MVSSHPEAEWDETEQQWMLALAEWRETHLCPMCGSPKEICQDARNEGRFVGQGYRCYATTAIRQAQEAAKNPGPGAVAAPHQDAVSWSARLRDEAAGTT